MSSLSVLTPVYNHARYLEAMVEAILTQSRLPDEFLLVDDASSDGTWPLIEALRQRYPLIQGSRNPTNRGVLANATSLLSQTRSDYLYSASSDDLVLPGFFEQAMSLLEAHPYAPLCCGQAVWWDEETEEQYVGGLQMPQHNTYLSPEECLVYARRGCLDLAGHASLFRTDALLKIGGYREKLRWHCDWLALYELAFRHGICWVAQPLAVMRTHASSYSGTGTRQKAQHDESLVALIDYLLLPSSRPVREAFAQSGLLALLGYPMARHLLTDPRRWRLLSGRYLGFLLEPLLRTFKMGRGIVRTLREGGAPRTAPSAFDLSRMRPKKK
ncbi:Glycosyl transferase family 2 [Verrucomicrobium sp. GAS474]|uniref:glycosyltransferase family 2 protein n=1 Tax=Verrucomicrobium sp. GAS474 TaxID=1882831 RepID=UPI00087C2489|nr:glycosyltransferase family A protein [Verrucomicrobium sp. GAS474]SDT94641.1 Glycosyl transferase family 2 [Verrucomicrobium sp. GAS474]